MEEQYIEIWERNMTEEEKRFSRAQDRFCNLSALYSDLMHDIRRKMLKGLKVPVGLAIKAHDVRVAMLHAEEVYHSALGSFTGLSPNIETNR